MKLPLENILFSALKIVVNQILPIIILPYLMKRLGDHQFGLMMIAQTVSLFGVTTVEYGFNLTGVRRVVMVGSDRLQLLHLFRDINLVKLLFCAACVLLFCLFSLVSSAPADLVLAMACSFLTVLGAALQPNWFFMGLERFKVISLSQVAARAVCLLSLFFVVAGPQDYLPALVLFFLPTLLSAGIQLGFCRQFFSGVDTVTYRFRLENLVRCAVDGVDIYMGQMAATLFASVNTLVLGLVSGPADSGRYAFAEKIMRGLAVLSTPITEAIFPRVVAGLESNLPVALRFLRRILAWGAVAYAMGAVAAYFFFDAAMTLLALQRGSDIKQIFAVIAIVPALIFVNNICGTQVVLGLGHARLYRNVVLVSGLALVVWSAALVMAWGVQGAAWALLLGEIGICAGMVWASLKVVRYPWIWR